MLKIKMLPVLFLTIVIAGTACRNNSHATGKTYYLSSSGNDGNPGTLEKPWKTLSRINGTRLYADDKILLEGGSIFTGTLNIDSIFSSAEDRDIEFGSYGKGRAIIDGGVSEGIHAANSRHIVIKNLIIKGTGRLSGNSSDGVLFTGSRFVVLDSIEISGFQHSGLQIAACSDFRITGIYSHDNGFAGINISGSTIYDTVNYDNQNIYIGHCIAENNPGDPTVKKNHSGNGILASSVKHGTIEYCEASDNGWDMPWTGNGPVGIWIWDCTDFTIQYCVSHDNKTNPVAKDGGGFDLDGGVSNSVIQYCVSYNNQGAGYGLFEFGAGKHWKKNTIRYNISKNDGLLNEGSLSVWKMENAGWMGDCEIYNNTFYNDTLRGAAVSLVSHVNSMNFRNNIFVYKGSFLNMGQKIVKEHFTGNCYWDLSGDKKFEGCSDLHSWARKTGNEMLNGKFLGRYEDPGLANPRRISIKDFSGFALGSRSPLIDQGLDLKVVFDIDPGNHDLAGTKIPQGKGFDPGAIEYNPGN